MGANKFIVALFDEDDSTAESLIARLSCAWPGAIVPRFQIACGNSLEPPDLEAGDGIVVVARADASPTAVLSLLAMVEEAAIPALALLDAPPEPGNPFEFAGAVVHERDRPAEELAAVLRALGHRQSEVRRLRNEIEVSRRHQGGLRGQMSKVHEELQLAAMVQREFLPRELPVLHGVRFAAMWRPAHYVSGDLYDVTRLDEDRVGVFIADSIGHGVPAALMTMIICRSLAMKEVDANSYRLLPPAEVLARLNADMIARQGQSTRFATAAYAVVDCRARTMTLAGAGHPPPIILRGDGSTETVRTSGGLLGVFEDEKYDQVEIELDLGDRLLLYSDGFEQAFPEEGDGSRARPATTRYLEEFQRLRGPAGPAEMIDAIRSAVDDQHGSLHQADDLTLVCMEAGALPVAGESYAPSDPVHSR